ncbi:hypothetical protein Q8F55_002241 [Vanrija albida]|uniref:Major facilitator superfamily (MFS) profile domain-containing protein n=1 Tax=Vanrija albida TaxID=181172 RepID=A0ABR3Q9G4_9TREE
MSTPPPPLPGIPREPSFGPTAPATPTVVGSDNEDDEEKRDKPPRGDGPSAAVPGTSGREPSLGAASDWKEAEAAGEADTGDDIAPAAAPPELSRAQRIGLVSLGTAVMCMSAGGQQGLNIALPLIQTELGIKEADLQWVASAYSLTSGCFLLLSGRLADVYGRKLCFIIGMLWYALWCLVGAFLHSGPAFIVTRALAGAGASMGIPSAMGIIGANIHGKQRATAFAMFAAGAPIGGGTGIILGGVLASYTDKTWRPVVWMFAGLAFGIALLAMYFVPRDRHDEGHDRRVDWVGAFLITAGLVLLQFSVSDAASAPKGWRTPYIPACFAISIVLITAFFFWEYHVIHRTSRPPLLRLALFTRARGRLAAMYLVGFTAWMGFVSTGYQATLFYQQVQMTGSMGAALRFLPCPIAGLTCVFIVSRLVHILPTVAIACIGLASTALSGIFLAVSSRNQLYWTFPFNAMYLWVVGADFILPTGSIFVSRMALPQEQSVGGALWQTILQLGGSFGLTFTSVAATSVREKWQARGLDHVDAIHRGLQAAFWLSSALSLLALVIAAASLHGIGLVSQAGEKQVGDRPVKESREAAEAEKA